MAVWLTGKLFSSATTTTTTTVISSFAASLGRTKIRPFVREISFISFPDERAGAGSCEKFHKELECATGRGGRVGGKGAEEEKS